MINKKKGVVYVRNPRTKEWLKLSFMDMVNYDDGKLQTGLAELKLRTENIENEAKESNALTSEQFKLLDQINKQQDDRLHYIETKIGMKPTKHWKSGEIVEQGQTVTMHNEFFVAKKATNFPPMFTLTDKAGNRLTDSQGNYLLTGEYNTTDYEKIV